MIYNSFLDLKISALGMGAMRFPTIGEDYSKIDEPAVKEMVDFAMDHGINYYDTAYGYHEGNSEVVLGKCLKNYPRDRFYLADKFPGYDLSKMDQVADIFEMQLARCGVEYFDFYLFHNVCEMNIDAYLDETYGILAYLMEQKKNGRIKHLGFSVHGSYEVMERFLDAYGAQMEFCQIQLNYLDWSFQGAKEKVELLSRHGIPVWVMEPMRGGQLADLPEKQTAALKAMRPNETIPVWAFRFLQSLPDVVVTLSGASNLAQLKENIKAYEEGKSLEPDEMTGLLDAIDHMISEKILPCTACRYCTSHCPQNLDIPELLKLYNEHRLTEGGFIAPMALRAVPEEKQPSACTSCKSCEALCPQQIKISDAMGDFVNMLKE